MMTVELLREAIRKFLSDNGHELCHENRKELALAAGIDLGIEPWPTLPPESEFRNRCEGFRQQLYGCDLHIDDTQWSTCHVPA